MARLGTDDPFDDSTLKQAYSELENKGPLSIDQLDEKLTETNRDQTREVLAELMDDGRVASTPDWKYRPSRRG